MSETEPLIRSGNRTKERFWRGCQAGLSVIVITSDGTVRGCLSIPPALNEGSLRQKSLREIWLSKYAFTYNRWSIKSDLREHCATCAFGHLYRAGCKSMAFILTGNTSFNPFVYGIYPKAAVAKRVPTKEPLRHMRLCERAKRADGHRREFRRQYCKALTRL